jgi:hypothetical protein
MRWTTPDGIDVPSSGLECNEQKEPSTMEITTVGLDIAKRVFQLHGVDAAGKGSIAAEAATVGGAGVLQGPTALFGWH